MKMSLNVIDNAPPIAHPSVRLKKQLLILNVTSVANFNDKSLKMSSISFYYISDLKYNQLSQLLEH